MLIKHEHSFLFIEDFCEEILLEKQGLKNLVNNYKFQFYLDWIQHLDDLSDFEIESILRGEEDAKYYFNILMYKKAFIDFILGIKKIIREEDIFFKNLVLVLQCDEDYSNPDNQKSLVLISDIYSLESKYFSILGLEGDEDFLKVKNKINKIYNNFTRKYFIHKHAKNVDQVLTGVKLGNEQIFDQELYIKSDKKTVYLDTNIFSRILEKSEIREKIILSKYKFQYCYSAYLLEDKVKQNILFTNKVFNSISEITDNVMISSGGKYPQLEMTFAVEDPKSVFNRVKLWLFQTQSAEDNQFNCMILDRIIYKKNVKAKFFNVQEMINYLTNPDDNLKILADSLCASSAFDKDVSTNEKISALLKILNVLEFKIDKKRQKIISSFQDEEHLRVAHIADYFITDDDNLSSRAEVIYKICECETKVILFKNFLENL
jgi:hypothetical protein